MSEAQAWLPSMALVDGKLTEAVGATLARWHGKWISQPGLLTVKLQTPGRKSQQPEEGWRTSCGSLAASMDRELALRLGASLLALRRPPPSAIAADKRLLQAVAGDAVRDLLGMLAVRFRAASATEYADQLPIAPFHLRFAVRGSRGPLFHLVVAAGAAATARKAVASPRRPLAPLNSRPAVADAICIKASARIGTCRVTASDLDSLLPGDVLVLDSRISEHPQLAINGQVVEGERLSLAREGAALVIRSLESGSV